ncbi:sh3 domain-containing [Anaeramoeba flamelloides]|uniref:Sh3 domain-containing n=1 Tax=Anaeramoeba flamelloides TaxID=1746091 RepID=A0AAV7YJE9_9EUKA|nr:sh3 domain-containing [Anaeramoeba flamelloides]
MSENMDYDDFLFDHQDDPKAYALCDYTKKKESELSFQKGEIIFVTGKNETGWWQGETISDIGLFHTSMIKLEEEENSDRKTQNLSEISGITFQLQKNVRNIINNQTNTTKNNSVNVGNNSNNLSSLNFEGSNFVLPKLENFDQNRSYGSRKKKKRVIVAIDESEIYSNESDHENDQKARALNDYEGEYEGDINFKKGEIIYVYGNFDSQMVQAENQDRFIGKVPTKMIEFIDKEGNVIKNPFKTIEKSSLGASISMGYKPKRKDLSKRQDVEENESDPKKPQKGGKKALQRIEVNTLEDDDEDLYKYDPDEDHMDDPKAITTVDYTAQRSQELSFTKGEIIYITGTNESDWWQGEKIDFSIGLFKKGMINIIDDKGQEDLKDFNEKNKLLKMEEKQKEEEKEKGKGEEQEVGGLTWMNFLMGDEYVDDQDITEKDQEENSSKLAKEGNNTTKNLPSIKDSIKSQDNKFYPNNTQNVRKDNNNENKSNINNNVDTQTKNIKIKPNNDANTNTNTNTNINVNVNVKVGGNSNDENNEKEKDANRVVQSQNSNKTVLGSILNNSNIKDTQPTEKKINDRANNLKINKYIPSSQNLSRKKTSGLFNKSIDISSRSKQSWVMERIKKINSLSDSNNFDNFQSKEKTINKSKIINKDQKESNNENKNERFGGNNRMDKMNLIRTQNNKKLKQNNGNAKQNSFQSKSYNNENKNDQNKNIRENEKENEKEKEKEKENEREREREREKEKEKEKDEEKGEEKGEDEDDEKEKEKDGIHKSNNNNTSIKPQNANIDKNIIKNFNKIENNKNNNNENENTNEVQNQGKGKPSNKSNNEINSKNTKNVLIKTKKIRLDKHVSINKQVLKMKNEKLNERKPLNTNHLTKNNNNVKMGKEPTNEIPQNITVYEFMVNWKEKAYKPNNDFVEFKVTAIDTFESDFLNDLSFKRGEVLTVIAQDKNGWCLGVNSIKNRGIFPNTFVKKIPKEDLKKRSVQCYRVIEGFIGKNKAQLTINVGDELELISRSFGNWVKVKMVGSDTVGLVNRNKIKEI